ncbi:hypothetical protein ARMGADRAFT_924954 [Armillaria gallica]|uniref:Integrase zinc-binding domain-containing protein n=1 Tax=Armillaria gallica TaxID=47427 RepID=A0A2H3DYI5_ARMGA|nr:hypothetical protein ARMGADRAFT_924954 [Armillaria gallica]
MTSCHDDVAHKGFYTTHVLIKEHYWWPDMKYDISWFIRTCHLCQICQTRQIYIPPTITLPAPLFSKMYMDTMIMPVSGQYRYIVQGRCSLSHYPEFYRITIRRRMGCSPYFAVTRMEPLLPMDIVESTWLMLPPDNIISTTSLIARRAISLQKRSQDLERLRSKVYKARRNATVKFEKDHEYSIRDFNFQKGDLVLMRNTQIEKALNRKMHARYLGPLVILGRNKGGAYLLCELDGLTFARPVAAFRLLPYFARKKIDVLDINVIIDVPPARINDLFASSDDGTLNDLPDLEGAHNEAELA